MTSHKLFALIFVGTILFSSFVYAGLSSQDTKFRVFTRGEVVYLSVPINITVNVNFDNQIKTNVFELGVHLDPRRHSVLSSTPLLQDYLEACKFKFIRLWTWTKSQPATFWNETTNTGIFDWTTLDEQVNIARSIGAEPIITVGVKSGKGVPDGMNENWKGTNLPNPDSFGHYAAEIVKHYIGKVQYWEIFNEFNWIPANVEDYVPFFNTVAQYMYAVDPSILIGCDACIHRAIFDYLVQHIQGMKFISFHRYPFHEDYSLPDDQVMALAGNLTQKYQTKAYSPNNMRQIWYEARGEILPIFVTETNIDSGWTEGTDVRTQQIFGAVWYAEEVRAFVEQDVRASCYYQFLSHDYTDGRFGYGYGMVDDSSPHDKWYPYFTNYLYGNNLDYGDKIFESSSIDANVLSSLAWKHGTDYKILLICKTSDIITVGINIVGLETEGAFVQKIEGTQDAGNIIGSIKELTISAPLKITLNGYSVVLLTVAG